MSAARKKKPAKAKKRKGEPKPKPKPAKKRKGESKPKSPGQYAQIIEAIFAHYYRPGIESFEFAREEIETTARQLYDQGMTKKAKVKNLGDVIYSFRHRHPLPESVLRTQPEGRGWLILGAGDARYRFRLSRMTTIVRTPGRFVIPVPDATPEIVAKYKLKDEQSLLAKIRYCRLIDTFLGITAYSLQNHYRTKIPNYGQIEIDELYVGVDKEGRHYVVPVQAKGRKDKLGAIQTIQDITYCTTPPRKGDDRPDFTALKCRAVSAQLYVEDGFESIAMFEVAFDGNDVTVKDERHYRLVTAPNAPPNPSDT